jgi:hypothetical protein
VTAIIKSRKLFDGDQHVLAYWLMFCRAPRKAEPDTDGMYDLSEIGEVRELKINRLTPYSIAEPSA